MSVILEIFSCNRSAAIDGIQQETTEASATTICSRIQKWWGGGDCTLTTGIEPRAGTECILNARLMPGIVEGFRWWYTNSAANLLKSHLSRGLTRPEPMVQMHIQSQGSNEHDHKDRCTTKGPVKLTCWVLRPTWDRGWEPRLHSCCRSRPRR